MKTMSSELVEFFKLSYPAGTRVQLDHMGNDPCPVPDGTKGTVTAIDDAGTVFVDFDNGRSIGVCPEADSFHKISERERAEEISPQMSM